MEFSSILLEATFKERVNRFLGTIDFKGSKTQCFIPNPGRMEELLFRGAKIYIQRKEGKNRKTQYDLTLVDLNGTLISVDSRVPNILVGEAIKEGKIPEFKRYYLSKREYMFEDSRLDYLLEGEGKKIFLEVKSCTLVKGTMALFPDAPTKRGHRHLNTLSRSLEYGRAVIFFVVQRPDASFFSPNYITDPIFTETLRKVNQMGVEVVVYNCNVSTKGLWIKDKLKAKIHRNYNKKH